MTSRHYDIVVLGRSLGALTAATLLARRDFRVLLLGQGEKPCNYRFDRFTLKRRCFSMLFNSSPVWKRTLQDLAQSPSFRRYTRSVEPMFSLLTSSQRLAISSRPESFALEIEREFPEVQQLVEEFYARLGTANAAIDVAFSRDIVWPPQSLWDKLDAFRFVNALPFVGDRDPGDLLAKFPTEHSYRELATLPVVFASDLDYGLMGMPTVAFARLHGSWTRGLETLTRGEDELSSFLLERFTAHGGVAQLNRSAESIVVQNGRATGIIEEGASEATGADTVITSLSGEALAELAGGQGIRKDAHHDWPEVKPTAGRFTVSVVVKTQGLPKPLSHESFLLPKDGPYPDPRQPVVHLQNYPASALGPDANPLESLLVAEAIIPAGGALTLTEARRAVMSTVRYHLPFLEQHIVAIDSPHDGLPLEDYSSGRCREIDRIHVKQTSSKPEHMDYQWSVEPKGLLELAGEPLAGPISGTYLVGKTVLPALGQEGELIAAWSISRLLTRRDSIRQRRRRQLWTKVETG
jgi:phytoene dehydrogenase-like protein